MKKYLLLIVLIFVNTNLLADNNLQIYLTITNIQKLEGYIYYSLFKGDKDFLNSDKCYKKGMIAVKDKTEKLIISDLEEGEYAIMIFQDLNDNKIMDKRKFPPMPSEPYGFSNNPSFWGKPKYDKCKFQLISNKTLEIKLK